MERFKVYDRFAQEDDRPGRRDATFRNSSKAVERCRDRAHADAAGTVHDHTTWVTGVILDVFSDDSGRPATHGTFNVITYTDELSSAKILANRQADLERFKVGAKVQIRYLLNQNLDPTCGATSGEEVVLEIYIYS